MSGEENSLFREVNGNWNELNTLAQLLVLVHFVQCYNLIITIIDSFVVLFDVLMNMHTTFKSTVTCDWLNWLMCEMHICIKCA